MTFSSPEFFFFLAFSLFAYSLAAAKLRPLVLLFVSLAWYASWRLQWVALFVGIGVLNHQWLRLAARRKATAPYVLLALLDAAILVLFKGGQFFADWPAPVGASFSMLFLIGVVIDYSRKRGARDPGGILDFLVLACFFPVHLGGPIERHSHLSPQLRKLGPVTLANVVDGSAIFALGFLKTFFVAMPLERETLAWPDMPRHGWLALLYIGSISLFWAYASFSGVCDMGRGAARMFGVEIEQNFRPFYYSRNPSEFWQRWNITLGTWIRDYVSMPAMLSLGRKLGRYTVILLAFLLVGLWHGLAPNWFWFGVFNGVLIVLSLWLQNGPLRKKPRAARVASWALVIPLLVGDGILWRPDILLTFGSPAAHSGHPWHFEWAGVLAPLFALAAVDFLQERLGKADFFLDAPFVAKFVGVAVFCAWLLFGLHEGTFVTPATEPPLYFRF